MRFDLGIERVFDRDAFGRVFLNQRRAGHRVFQRFAQGQRAGSPCIGGDFGQLRQRDGHTRLGAIQRFGGRVPDADVKAVVTE